MEVRPLHCELHYSRIVQLAGHQTSALNSAIDESGYLGSNPSLRTTKGKNMAEIYTPPFKWYNQDANKLLFLAGPIKGSDDWQSQAIATINKLEPSIAIANPRRENMDELNPNEWTVQVEWETLHLRMASANGGIMFWLAPEINHDCSNPFAKTTRFEFAEWLTHYKYRKQLNPDKPLKIILGIDDKFPGRDYIIYRVFSDCPEFVVATTLEETCQLAVDVLK